MTSSTKGFRAVRPLESRSIASMSDGRFMDAAAGSGDFEYGAQKDNAQYELVNPVNNLHAHGGGSNINPHKNYYSTYFSPYLSPYNCLSGANESTSMNRSGCAVDQPFLGHGQLQYASSVYQNSVSDIPFGSCNQGQNIRSKLTDMVPGVYEFEAASHTSAYQGPGLTHYVKAESPLDNLQFMPQASNLSQPNRNIITSGQSEMPAIKWEGNIDTGRSGSTQPAPFSDYYFQQIPSPFLAASRPPGGDLVPEPQSLSGPTMKANAVIDLSEENDSSSDDEEPLLQKAKRRQETASQTNSILSRLTQSPSKSAIPPPQQHDNRPLPPSLPPKTLDPLAPYASAVGHTNDPMAWKLPTYEARYEASADGYPQAKVSLPGMILEPIFLSPDHSLQEFHLLTHIFMPGQESLPTPDPDPRTALLNFHTIALMVFQAYAQFEAGDEMHGRPSVEGVRVCDARDADPDAIFFAVVDAWQIKSWVGVGKQAYRLVRGVQEFCDVALDVIFYIKENGLLRVEKRRKERCDKGKKRGVRKADGKGEEGGLRKRAREEGTARKANELQPRKKGRPRSRFGSAKERFGSCTVTKVPKKK